MQRAERAEAAPASAMPDEEQRQPRPGLAALDPARLDDDPEDERDRRRRARARRPRRARPSPTRAARSDTSPRASRPITFSSRSDAERCRGEQQREERDRHARARTPAPAPRAPTCAPARRSAGARSGSPSRACAAPVCAEREARVVDEVAAPVALAARRQLLEQLRRAVEPEDVECRGRGTCSLPPCLSSVHVGEVRPDEGLLELAVQLVDERLRSAASRASRSSPARLARQRRALEHAAQVREEARRDRDRRDDLAVSELARRPRRAESRTSLTFRLTRRIVASTSNRWPRDAVIVSAGPASSTSATRGFELAYPATSPTRSATTSG